MGPHNTQKYWVERVRAALNKTGGNWVDCDCQPLKELPIREEIDGEGSCEVLARLVLENGERVKAGEWINHVCDDLPLMREIDRAVITRLGEIHEDRAFTFHAINLSAGSLNDLTTVSFVQDWLDTYNLNPRNLCFEITEQVLAQPGPSLEVLNNLRELGCLIALDDFGTGQNSFTSLNDYPIDVLKIDGSFVEGLTRNPKTSCIVEHIMSLGKNLDLKVVAEFISSKELLEKLVVIKGRIELLQGGCVDLHGQGNFIGNPQPCSSRPGERAGL